MNFDALIFDLDGTLLNTLDDLADSANRVLSQHDFPMHQTEAYKRFIGNGAGTLIRRALPESVDDNELISAVLADFRKEYSSHMCDRTEPYEGILSLLDQCKALKIPLSVLSNKPDEMTRMMVKRFFGAIDFHSVRGARQDMPIKPDPSLILSIAESTGVNPTRMCHVGDSDVDMIMAHRAGCFSVGVLWGFRDREELVKNHARRIISDPGQLIEIINTPQI